MMPKQRSLTTDGHSQEPRKFVAQIFNLLVSLERVSSCKGFLCECERRFLAYFAYSAVVLGCLWSRPCRAAALYARRLGNLRYSRTKFCATLGAALLPRVHQWLSNVRIGMKATCALLLLGLMNSGLARTVSISNDTLVAAYDEISNTFSLAERGSGLAFLKEGKLDGIKGNALVESVKDPIFRTGKRIKMMGADGRAVSLELYKELP